MPKRTEEHVKILLKENVETVYRELSKKVRQPDSEIMPRLIKKIAGIELAHILNTLPGNIEEIAKKLELEKSDLIIKLQYLSERGLIRYSNNYWQMISQWGELHDAIGSANPRFDNDDVFDLAFEMTEEWLEQLTQVISRGSPFHIMRVVPHWRTIKDIPGVLPFEDTRQILREWDSIGVMNCACKKIDRNRKCAHEITTETCLVNATHLTEFEPDHYVRIMDYDEAIVYMDELGKIPLVHMTETINAMPRNLCNCHTCCCGIYNLNRKTKARYNWTMPTKSRFVARIDAEKCKNCHICIDKRCPVGAIKMKYYEEFGENRPWIDSDECIGCGLCVLTCPEHARKMELVRPPEHIGK